MPMQRSWRDVLLFALASLTASMTIILDARGQTPETTQEVETPDGRWRVQSPSPIVIQSMPQAARDAPAFSRDLRNVLATGHLISPIVTSREDLSRLLVGRNVGPTDLEEQMAALMQAVPELPNRYGGDRYKPIRDAFTPECTKSVGLYRGGAIRLFNSTQIATDILSSDIQSLGRDYERNCLTSLNSVPAQIRGVIGVLVSARSIPWCSATIIDEHHILTTRHCFVDPITGSAEAERAQLMGGRIGFVTPTLHHGVDAFTVARVDGQVVPLAPFGPTDDYLVLAVEGGKFERHASLQSARLAPEAMPMPVWIVGSNKNLTDVNSLGQPLDFTRGSSPKACAILEVTSNGCLYHACQTGRATSGAGLLSIGADNTVSLLGVHKAAIVEASGCEATPPVDLRLNLAINITTNNVGQ